MGWTGFPGSGQVGVDGDVTLTASGSFIIGSGANVGSGHGVIAVANVITAPVSLGALYGGILYIESGHLFYLGDGGTLTQVASR